MVPSPRLRLSSQPLIQSSPYVVDGTLRGKYMVGGYYLDFHSFTLTELSLWTHCVPLQHKDKFISAVAAPEGFGFCSSILCVAFLQSAPSESLDTERLPWFIVLGTSVTNSTNLSSLSQTN